MSGENIPIQARVECADGVAGHSTAVVFNPLTRQITHIVVEGSQIPGGRTVPLDRIISTTAGLIRLSCTGAELEKMPAFTEVHYVKSQQPVFLPGTPDISNGMIAGYPAYMTPIVLPAGTAIPEEVEVLPQGETSIHRGMPVMATDGHVGEIGEFIIDPATGAITHIMLREGHLWGRREVTLPLSAVDRTEPGAVYLKLDRQAVGMLPSIPVKRPDWLATYGKDVELVAFIFDDTQKAGDNLKFLKELHRAKRLKILSAAVLVKQPDGRTSVHEMGDMKAGGGALRGAIIGGALALLGPIGMVAGLVGGAAIGGIAAQLHDSGFKNKFLDGARQQLKPGTSALLVVVEHDWINSLSEVMSDQPGVMLQTTLTDRIVENLLAAGGKQ